MFFEFFFQTENFLASESGHTRERQELENRLKGLQNIVEEKSKEIDKLTQINVQVQQSLKMEVDKSLKKMHSRKRMRKRQHLVEMF